MALHFEIKVNSMGVGYVYIRRQEVEPAPGVPCHYSVEVRTYGTLDAPADTRTAVVEHLYEDGALVLIGRAIDAITTGEVRTRV